MNSRLKEEYKEIIMNPLNNIGMTIGLFKEDNLYEGKLSLLGAKDSPYKGGLFFLKLSFPQEYPNKGPKIIFLTPIYHINVNCRRGNCSDCEELGYVSVSFINWWKPETTVKEILTQLFSIFYWPNPDFRYST